MSNFRMFFLSLLTNESQRLSYMRDEYEMEFGRNFMQTVERMVAQFQNAVNTYLPATVFEQVGVNR